MGGQAQTALAFATIPTSTEKLMADDLTQLMSGALKSLSEDNVELIGGLQSVQHYLRTDFLRRPTLVELDRLP